MRHILVIKLSALGDFVLSLGAMQAIRAHHRGERIALLTTAPFEALARASGCFEEIWIDRRAPLWRPDLWLPLACRLRAAGFDRVYDLQRSGRTGWYFRLAGRPDWVGKVPGCSHPYVPPPGTAPHIVEWEREQLARAGVGPVTAPDLSFIEADTARFGLPRDMALLVPGSAPHRPEKRWPAAGYGALARTLAAQGTTPVLIGGPAERAEAEAIARACPAARNLCGETSLFDIAALARHARVAVGNDTGPMHLIAAAGCPTLVLFSRASHPTKSRPPWPHVETLREARLSDLPAAAVEAALERIARPASPDPAAGRA